MKNDRFLFFFLECPTASTDCPADNCRQEKVRQIPGGGGCVALPCALCSLGYVSLKLGFRGQGQCQAASYRRQPFRVRCRRGSEGRRERSDDLLPGLTLGHNLP